jgi:hypothetical protein
MKIKLQTQKKTPRMCDMSRPSLDKYIKIIEAEKGK